MDIYIDYEYIYIWMDDVMSWIPAVRPLSRPEETNLTARISYSSHSDLGKIEPKDGFGK